MPSLRAIYHIATTNLLVRLRDRRFLAVAAGGVYLGHLVVTGDIELALANQNYRGAENTAWIGTLMSLTASIAVLLFGFYLVTGTLERDRQARLGRLIASSPAGSIAYLIGTWVGNALFLLCLVGVMAASAAVLLILRGHGAPHLPSLLAPFALFSGPVATLTAALALAFECLPGLRGRTGGIVYFVLALSMLVLPAATSVPFDPLGMTALHESMTEALLTQQPGAAPGDMFSFGYFEDIGTLTAFHWPGVTVTAQLLLQRLGIVVGSLGLVIGASGFFQRFDPSPEGWTRYRRWAGGLLSTTPSTPSSSSSETKIDSLPLSTFGSEGPADEMQDAEDRPCPSVGSLPGRRTFRPLRMVRAELRLALSERSWTWRLGALGLVGAGFVRPDSTGVLTLAWLWPLMLWSALGTRATTFRTKPLLTTTLYPWAQRLAAWGAGAVVALGMSLGPLLLGGRVVALVGVVFVPALALAAGRVSGTPRLFEIAFLLLWYLGPANQQAVLDFTGSTSVPLTTQGVYLLSTLVLLWLAVPERENLFSAR